MWLDVNACFGHWQYGDLYHKTPEDLIGLMDRNGIDRAVVLSLRGIFLDWREGNRETLEAAVKYPERFVPTATISPFLGGNADGLRRALDAGARGVRLFPAFHSYRLDSEFMDDICRAAAERQAPVMIQTRIMMNWRFQAIPIDNVGTLIDRHPQTRFIVSGPNYLIEFQGLVRVMKRCPNVWYEISCLQGFNAVRKLVDEVGQNRVLFGTGAVLNYPACNVSKLNGADLTAGQRRQIAWDNGSALFGLK